jgi:hypothetical protein
MRKMQIAFVFAIIAQIAVSSCNSKSYNPDIIQLLINSSVEAGGSSPNKWWANVGSYTSAWSADQSFSGAKSLMLSSDNDAGVFGYWGQTVYADIPYGRGLRLSCMIKLEDVDPLSDGVSIAIRGDDADGNGVFFYSTQGDVPIHGNEDWTKYSIDMKSNIPESTDRILVFLILLDDTYGTVYFDDITLETIN